MTLFTLLAHMGMVEDCLHRFQLLLDDRNDLSDVEQGIEQVGGNRFWGKKVRRSVNPEQTLEVA
jgi:hypothetical protein